MAFSYRSAPENKDHMRIRDIVVVKAAGDKEKQAKLAHQQAKIITDPYKALRRGRAAIEVEEFDVAKIFLQRVIDLNQEKLLSREDLAAMEDISQAYDLGVWF
jgi:hypothetical protein